MRILLDESGYTENQVKRIIKHVERYAEVESLQRLLSDNGRDALGFLNVRVDTKCLMQRKSNDAVVAVIDYIRHVIGSCSVLITNPNTKSETAKSVAMWMSLIRNKTVIAYPGYDEGGAMYVPSLMLYSPKTTVVDNLDGLVKAVTNSDASLRIDHLSEESQGIAKTIIETASDVLGAYPDTGGCVTFYTPEQWRERSESYGLKSKLIVVYDGGDLAKFFCCDYQAYDHIDAMDAALRKLGYFAEPCTNWYSAIYEE